MDNGYNRDSLLPSTHFTSQMQEFREDEKSIGCNLKSSGDKEFFVSNPPESAW